MYTLQNDALTVLVLDPAADQERFGTRYCTGGYIFQVEDARVGALLSGPTYPDSFNTFDGQGIPDAFNLSPLRDPAATLALIVGVGLCDLAANRVAEFCSWEVRHDAAAITLATRHTLGGIALTLERTVALHDRTLRSATRLANTGAALAPIRWFPHPFYPQPEGDVLCRLSVPVQLPASDSYELRASGFIARKGWPWHDGRYQPLDHAAQAPLTIQQAHPLLGLVGASCSYVPSFFPIWGNARTFSWEPFFERTLAPGQQAAWWIDYDF